MTETTGPAKRKQIVGERRWPMVAAVLVAVVMHELLPDDFRLAPLWIYPVIMAVFLVLLIAGDPGLIDQEKRWLRVVTGLLIAMLALTNLISAIRLVPGHLRPGRVRDRRRTSSSGSGPSSGRPTSSRSASGTGTSTAAARCSVRPTAPGPTRRSSSPRCTPEELKPGWFPQFADYVALSFNTATAFSPTDVSAIKPWAKYIMILESSSSLVLATLVISSAINGLGN